MPDVGACDYERDSRELCPMGDPDADRSIVVFGNSHGRMWIPAFDQIGSELGYRTYYLVKPNCAASLVSVGELVPGSPLWPACDDFRSWALDQIATLAPRSGRGLLQRPQPGPVRRLRHPHPRATARRTRPAPATSTCSPSSPGSRTSAVLLRDVPKSEEEPATCLTTGKPDLGDCMFKPLAASVRDADISEEAAAGHRHRRSSTRRSGCAGRSRCPVVIGDVLPYRDRGHLTTVYARSLSDELAKAMGLSEG